MITRGRRLRHLGFDWGRQGETYAGQTPPESDSYLMPLILDAPLPADAAGRPGDSLLMLPLGSGLLVDHLVARLSVLGSAKVLVVPPAGEHRPYEDRLDPDVLDRLRIVKPDQLLQMVTKGEASDYLFLVDPRYWPAVGYDFAFIARQARRYQGATHAIAVGGNAGQTRERVEYDPQGQIRRVQRLYSPMSWPATAAATVFCSVVPARALVDLAFQSLGELRCRLVGRGVLAQDLPVLSDVDDLTRQAGILTCSQRMVSQLLAGPVPSDLVLRSPGVLVGEGCRIDSTVRVVPPVLVQDFVTVEPEAMLVGPLVIGSGSRIGRRAVVAQSIVLPNAEVPAETAIRNTIGVGSLGTPLAACDLQPTDSTSAAIERGGGCVWPAMDLSLQDLPRRRRVQQAIKRLADIVLAGTGLLLVSPLLIVVALLIKCTSPGPLFFIHRRERQGGRTFGCIKFRTMIPDAHAKQRDMYKQNQVDGPQFKMDNDPRVTRLGRILRATNIDELPQLFNVLAGHMSLIGPRPSPFRENQICVAWRKARLSVRPGITGLWQICRDRRCDGDFHQWIFYDITYVRHFSLWLDVRILVQTVLSAGGRKRVALSKLLPIDDPNVAGPHGEPLRVSDHQDNAVTGSRA